ncbi:MarR family winged helix-turn-helix transcriptional regulator [Tolumonas lignilytica]|uniref:MarR family winged helix-turn-helix transcriptional regulator n=1 Tax=Tolumonas lignilytica TaxID=1283284 RepID=UPI0004668649|nr:MarR family transcriptional regulator [Tolumonas lignilytica]
MSAEKPADLLLLDNQLCFALYSASNAIVRAYRPLLDQLDLTYPQYLVMLVLWQQDGVSVKQLGEQLFLDSGTLTPLLKRLEVKGLLRRERSEQDERLRVLTLTEQGKALKKQAADIPLQMRDQLQLSDTQLQLLKTNCELVQLQLNKNTRL